MSNFKKFAFAAGLLLCALGVRAAEADAPAYLSVCVDDDNAPFSSEARPAADIVGEGLFIRKTQAQQPPRLKKGEVAAVTEQRVYYSRRCLPIFAGHFRVS